MRIERQTWFGLPYEERKISVRDRKKGVSFWKDIKSPKIDSIHKLMKKQGNRSLRYKSKRLLLETETDSINFPLSKYERNHG